MGCLERCYMSFQRACWRKTTPNNVVSVQAAPELESASAEIEDLVIDLATVETDNPGRDISKESGNIIEEEVAKTNRSGRVSKPKKR